MRIILSAVALLAFSLAGDAQAGAGSVCTRAVRLIVPVQAGSSGDTVARLLAEHLKAESGMVFYVENKAGGAGLLAAKELRHSDPDGCTLMLGINSNIAGGLEFYREEPYDPLTAFSLIGLVGRSPVVLVTSSSLGVRTIEELVSYAHKHKEGIFFARVNAISRIMGFQFSNKTGAGLIDVSYAGEHDGLIGLMRGDMQIGFVVGPSAKAWLSNPSIRGLAVTSNARSVLFPDLPTLAEAGVKGFEEAIPIYALVGPKGMKAETVSFYSRLLEKTLAREAFRRALLAAATEPMSSSPEDLRAFIMRDRLLWRSIIERNGLQRN